MDNANKFNERLARIYEATGAKSNTELANALEISPPSVLAAKKREQIPTGWIEKIAEKYDVSTDWLFFGTETQKATTSKQETVAQKHNDIVWIPLVKAVLSAGQGSLETSDQYEREYAFRLDFISRKGDPKNMVLMRVSGDSMAPEVMHNDVVLIDQSKTIIAPGHMYAVNFEDAIYLKRIDKVPGKVILKSANTAYPPVELNIQGQQEQLLRIIGQVLWSGREYH